MANILINGISAKAAGGKSVLTNFLNRLQASPVQDHFVIVVPANSGYQQYSNEKIKVLEFNQDSVVSLRLMIYNFFTIKKLVREYKISLVVNFADVVPFVNCKQVYYFDWPYAIYPESIVWQLMSRNDYYFRKIKLRLIKNAIRRCNVVITQTEIAASRLRKLFKIANTVTIPNAVSVETFTGGEEKNFELDEKKVKLLCLTKYYPHKNLEILISVAREIREKGLPYVIVTTINKSDGAGAEKLLEDLRSEGLTEIIINVGAIEMKFVPSLYRQTDALLLPTLLESFSGTYPEAMFHKKPILTSDLDFARDVCGDTAFYFDPLNSSSILTAIQTAFENDELRIRKITEAAERLTTFPDWQKVFEKILKVIQEQRQKTNEQTLSNLY